MKNGAIRVLDIEIYGPEVETWAQGRYLVHGHDADNLAGMTLKRY